MKYDTGLTIGSYKLISVCGAGAYGSVFCAQNIMTQHRVALKILSMSDKIMQRELQGIVNYRECRHPNLLQIHHIEKIDDCLYYTMDLADNISVDENNYIPDTLAHRLSNKKSLPAAEVNKMATELLDGLEYLHAHGLVHRDIKPDNILWIDGRATLADIGLTANLENASLVGTPGFMSEALLTGKRTASIEDDLYALGKVIYCALTGCRVKEYPHYPGTLTISDADSLIKAYTEACRSPSPVKSSQDMRAILSSKSNIKPVKKSINMQAVITASIILIAVAIVCFFYYSRGKQNTGNRQGESLPSSEKTSGARLPVETETANSQNTIIIPSLQAHSAINNSDATSTLTNVSNNKLADNTSSSPKTRAVQTIYNDSFEKSPAYNLFKKAEALPVSGSSDKANSVSADKIFDEFLGKGNDIFNRVECRDMKEQQSSLKDKGKGN